MADGARHTSPASNGVQRGALHLPTGRSTRHSFVHPLSSRTAREVTAMRPVRVVLIHTNTSVGPSAEDLRVFPVNGAVARQWSDEEIEQIAYTGEDMMHQLGKWFWSEYKDLLREGAGKWRTSATPYVYQSSETFVGTVNQFSNRTALQCRPQSRGRADSIFRDWRMSNEHQRAVAELARTSQQWAKVANLAAEFTAQVYLAVGYSPWELPEPLERLQAMICIQRTYEAEIFWPDERDALTRALTPTQTEQIAHLAVWVWEQLFFESDWGNALGEDLAREVVTDLWAEGRKVSVYATEHEMILALVSRLGLCEGYPTPAMSYASYLLVELYGDPAGQGRDAQWVRVSLNFSPFKHPVAQVPLDEIQMNVCVLRDRMPLTELLECVSTTPQIQQLPQRVDEVQEDEFLLEVELETLSNVDAAVLATPSLPGSFFDHEVIQPVEEIEAPREPLESNATNVADAEELGGGPLGGEDTAALDEPEDSDEAVEYNEPDEPDVAHANYHEVPDESHVEALRISDEESFKESQPCEELEDTSTSCTSDDEYEETETGERNGDEDGEDDDYDDEQHAHLVLSHETTPLPMEEFTVLTETFSVFAERPLPPVTSNSDIACVPGKESDSEHNPTTANSSFVCTPGEESEYEHNPATANSSYVGAPVLADDVEDVEDVDEVDISSGSDKPCIEISTENQFTRRQSRSKSNSSRNERSQQILQCCVLL